MVKGTPENPVRVPKVQGDIRRISQAKGRSHISKRSCTVRPFPFVLWHMRFGVVLASERLYTVPFLFFSLSLRAFENFSFKKGLYLWKHLRRDF